MTRAYGCFHHDEDRLASMPMMASSTTLTESFDLSYRSKMMFQPVLGNNDVVNDCTAVALMNLASWSNYLKTDANLAINEDRCVPFYASVVGCPPTVEAARMTDGAYMIDVINKQIDDGYDMGVPGMPMIVGKFWNTPLHRATLATAMRLYGGLALEIGVTEQDDLSGDGWQVLPTRQRTNHAVCASWCTGVEDSDTVSIFTWGNRVDLTWSALECRLNVAWCAEYPWHGDVTE